MASAGRNSYPGGMNYDSHPGGMNFDSRPGGISYDSMRRKGGGLCGQGRESHVAIFGEDPTMPLFISHVWFDQKRRDKNVTFTKFLFHWWYCLDWLHSKGEVEGFHLRFVNGTTHFRWLLTPHKDLPNWPEIFRLLRQPCFQRFF